MKIKQPLLRQTFSISSNAAPAELIRLVDLMQGHQKIKIAASSLTTPKKVCQILLIPHSIC